MLRGKKTDLHYVTSLPLARGEAARPGANLEKTPFTTRKMYATKRSRSPEDRFAGGRCVTESIDISGIWASRRNIRIDISGIL